MNFEKAIDHVSSKLAMAITREDQHAILRPLLVEAYRDGKRRAKRELFGAQTIIQPIIQQGDLLDTFSVSEYVKDCPESEPNNIPDFLGERK